MLYKIICLLALKNINVILQAIKNIRKNESLNIEIIFPERELNIDPDLITCPLTHDILRHPILASDGRRYELDWLLKHLQTREKDKLPLISPVTSHLITSIDYDTQLKQVLDKNPLLERCESYDHIENLKTLSAYFTPPAIHWKKSAYKSIVSGGIVGCVGLLIYCGVLGECIETNEQTAHMTSFSLQLATGVGFIDYCCRILSRDRLSLFSAVTRSPVYAYRQADEILRELASIEYHNQ